MGNILPFQSRGRFIAESCIEHLNTAYVSFVSADDLKTFTFETRHGLHVEKSLSRLFGKKVIAQDGGTWLNGNRLLYTNWNRNIVKQLPTQFAYCGDKGMEILKPLLASLLLLQWDGSTGTLIEDGTENVFFFQKTQNGPRYAIEIFRDLSCNDWYMSAVELDGCEWLDCEWQEGARIFSAQKSLPSYVVNKNVINLFP